jgi:hypothetical protein
MRWMLNWIAPKDDEDIGDVLVDAMLALFSAAVATELIQIIFSN